MTFFVLKNNYLVTIISLTYCKRFRLEMLYGGTKMDNHTYRKEELRKRDCFFYRQLNTNPMMERDFGPGNRN